MLVLVEHGLVESINFQFEYNIFLPWPDVKFKPLYVPGGSKKNPIHLATSLRKSVRHVVRSESSEMRGSTDNLFMTP